VTFEITGFRKSGGPLTKRISLDDAGKPVSDGSACLMRHGAARWIRLGGVDELADLIGGLEPREALALGTLRPDLPDLVEVTTKES
jgi:hypothetical protein